MATPQLPTLFLSHSGQQKDFVWRLYRELLHVNHSPFFDQDSRLDSLPKGSPFPSRVLEACRACKLGIVVLSHDYIESMWPMLELQQLLFHNPSSPHNVFPIFYELKPADLCRPENLTRWRSAWNKHARNSRKRNRDQRMATPESLTLDIAKWPRALEMLRSQNGQIRTENRDNHPFIQTIVSDICKMHPPPESFLMGDHLKGAERIQQKIDELFQQQQQRNVGTGDACRRPISVGLHGVGGSGKTTMCKYMLNFYNKDYPGRCCLLEFPSKKEDKSQLLVKSMKDILSTHGYLAKETLETIKSVEQAMAHIQAFLGRYKVFLILDNVWAGDLSIARQIVTMDYMPGSKLLVTARSKTLLQNLSSHAGPGGPPPMQIIHVPSISEEEATDVLKAYSCTSLQYIGNGDDLRDLARSCFYEKQCHPLLLNAVGAKLRHLGGHVRSTEDWIQLCSRLKSHAIQGGEETEDIVVNVLKTSYDALHSSLQNTFLKLGTCIPKGRYHYHTLLGSSKWLSMISTAGDPQTTDDIRDQLIQLEYHGLLQIDRPLNLIVIHDLQMKLIQNIVKKKNGEPGCFFFQGDVGTLPASQRRSLKYIYVDVEDVSSALSVFRPRRNFFALDQRVTSPNVSGIEVLHYEKYSPLLGRGNFKGSLQLSVEDMRSLRHLALFGVEMKLEVGGWHGAPNLVSVELNECWQIQRIESMTCLQKLERFNMRGCHAIQKEMMLLSLAPKLQQLSVSCFSVDMGALSASSSLQELTVENDSKLHKVSVSNWVNLRKLSLRNCERLQTIEGSVHGFSTALEELSLICCWSLESIPGLNPVGNLKRLEVVSCKALDMEMLSAPSSLQELTERNIFKFHKLSVSNLRKLTLGSCEGLRSIEGMGTALEELELTECRSLESIPDLKLAVNLRRLVLEGCEALKEVEVVGNLRRLELEGCKALKEVRVGDAALTSLEELSLEDGRWHSLVSAPSCSPLPIAAFTNLRSLSCAWSRAESEVVNVAIDLPVNLERLTLRGRTKWWRTEGNLAKHLELSSLVHLRGLHIEEWPSLARVTGLGALTQLASLRISDCESLTEVGHWEAPFDSYKLSLVEIFNCPQLGTLSTTTMRDLSSLTWFFVYDSPNVQRNMFPQGAHGDLNGENI